MAARLDEKNGAYAEPRATDRSRNKRTLDGRGVTLYREREIYEYTNRDKIVAPWWWIVVELVRVVVTVFYFIPRVRGTVLRVIGEACE